MHTDGGNGAKGEEYLLISYLMKRITSVFHRDPTTLLSLFKVFNKFSLSLLSSEYKNLLNSSLWPVNYLILTIIPQ